MPSSPLCQPINAFSVTLSIKNTGGPLKTKPPRLDLSRGGGLQGLQPGSVLVELGGIQALLRDHRELLVGREARSSRDQAAHEDVLLETTKMIDLAVDRGLSEHTGRLLERCRRQEAASRYFDPARGFLRDKIDVDNNLLKL